MNPSLQQASDAAARAPATATADAFGAFRRETNAALEGVPPGALQAAGDVLERAWRAGRTVFVCGNGGSAANACHFAQDAADMMMRADPLQPLRAVSLAASASRLTALANDFGFASVFERQLMASAVAGDLLLGISCSGDSENVLRAARRARLMGLSSIGVIGFAGGQLRTLVDVPLVVPSESMAVLEAVHILLLDFLAKDLRHRVHRIAHGDR